MAEIARNIVSGRSLVMKCAMIRLVSSFNRAQLAIIYCYVEFLYSLNMTSALTFNPLKTHVFLTSLLFVFKWIRNSKLNSRSYFQSKVDFSLRHGAINIILGTLLNLC